MLMKSPQMLFKQPQRYLNHFEQDKNCLHLRDNGYLGPTVEYASPKTNRGQLPSPAENLNEAFNAPELSFQEPQRLKNLTNITDYEFPRLAFGADFSTRIQLMDPEHPLRKQLFMKLTARGSLAAIFMFGWRMDKMFTTISATVVNQTRRFKECGQILPSISEGKTGIDRFCRIQKFIR